WPKLKLVGKQSELVNEGARPGSFVLTDAGEVGNGKDPMRIVVISIAKEYWEQLPMGSEQRAQVYTTLDAVHEVGGTIEYDDKDGVAFRECGRCTVLVESPEEKSGFIFEADGKFYAPAEWFL